MSLCLSKSKSACGGEGCHRAREGSAGTDKIGKMRASSRSREKEAPESDRKQLHSQVKQIQSEDCVECAIPQRPWKLME